MSQAIRIFNPILGGSTYTSVRNAQRQVRNGRAFLRASDGMLQFRPAVQRKTVEEIHQLNMELEFKKNRPNGMVWWNGTRTGPNACYPPGCNVQFDSPERILLAAA